MRQEIISALTASIQLLSVTVALLTPVTCESTPSLNAGGFAPDTEELAESVLAPFMAFDGGRLYASHGSETDSTAVCGAESNSTSRIMLPVTLSDLDRLHGTLLLLLQRQHQEDPIWYRAQLDMVEGCYVLADGENLPCVASLQSDPSQCFMNIPDSTVYWSFRRAATLLSDSTEAFGGGADILVENILRVREPRGQLRRSIRRTQESAEAGRQLWQIVSRGWNSNAIEEDRQAFVEAVSTRGAEVVRRVYADVMEKWTVVKDWIRPSVGEIDEEMPTFTAEGGTLLRPKTYCNPSIYMDDWLTFFDPVYYGYHIASSIEREIQAFFCGYKIFYNNTGIPVDRLNHLPCVALSFAVAMMLFEDFPIRLAYWDMVNETGASDAIWPLQRFQMLGDYNQSVMRNKNYTITYYATAFALLTEEPHLTSLFGGNIPLAFCIRRAILRLPEADGSLPPSSIYECLASLRNSSRKELRTRAAFDVGGVVIGLGEEEEEEEEKEEGEDSDVAPTPPCPWGFVRPSGNAWNAQEDCVMCPPGSFDDGNGECQCSSNSYPTPDGCVAKEYRDSVSPSWQWLVNPAETLVASGSKNNVTPFLLVHGPPDAEHGDRVVVKMYCSRGLTRFVVDMVLPNKDISDTQRVSIPLRTTTTIVSESAAFIALATSAAFGGEQCDFTVSVRNPMYHEKTPVRVGAVFIAPLVPALQVHTPSLSSLPSSSSFPLTIPAMEETDTPSCDSVPRGKGGIVTVLVCSTHDKRLALLVDARGYTPFSVGAFYILKHALLAEGERAADLGRAMQPMGNRLRLAVKLKLEQRNTTKTRGALKMVFDGTFPIAHHDVYRLFVMPDRSVRIVVELQIVDYCATVTGAPDPHCANAHIIFVPSVVSSKNFQLQNNLMWEIDDWNGEDTQELASDWWQVPLIALSAVSALLFVTAGLLFALYLFRTGRTPWDRAREGHQQPHGASSSGGVLPVAREGDRWSRALSPRLWQRWHCKRGDSERAPL